jgi:hypothetical protein
MNTIKIKTEQDVEVDHIGVHVTHCCDKCGCRYGDEDCPVATGKLKPAYKCVDCESDRRYLIETLRFLSPEELAALLAEVAHREVGS